MSGVVLEDFFLLFLGETGRGTASSASSDKKSIWLSESTSESGPAETSAGRNPAVRVMCTLRAAPCRSAAERLNSGYTPVKP